MFFLILLSLFGALIICSPLTIELSASKHFFFYLLFIDYEIREMCEDETFDADANKWELTNLFDSNVRTTPCFGGILGGTAVENGGTYTRTYENLPTHQFVFVTVSAYRIDSWDGNDYFKIL